MASFQLRNGYRLLVSSRSAETQFLPELLCTLTGAERKTSPGAQEITCEVVLSSDAVTSAVKIFSLCNSSLYYVGETDSFEVRINSSVWQDGKFDALSRSYCGMLSILSVVLTAMLSGKSICLIHGALLQHDGKNIFLCGKSGIGKSTTCRRWKDEGGEALSDDMSLLEFCPDGIWLHPLPTWSKVAQENNGWGYPFSPALKLDYLLALGRASGHQELRKLQFYEFYQNVNSSVMFFYLGTLKHSPESVQRRLLDALHDKVDTLVNTYPNYGLLAHLDDNLHETMQTLF